MKEEKAAQESKDIVKREDFSLERMLHDVGSLHREFRNSMRGIFGRDPFFDQVDEYMDGLHARMKRYFAEHIDVPHVEVYGIDGGYGLRIEMPGVKREDISAEVDGRTLMLKAARTLERMVDGKKQEYKQPIESTIVLPYTIDTDKIEPTYENGVLDVKLREAEHKIVPIKVTA